MKRQIEEDHLEKNKIETNNIVIKNDEKTEIELLYDVFEDDEINEITININTYIKEIHLRKDDENGRKYKYIDKNIKSLINKIDDEFMFKNINMIILIINDNNISSSIYEWKDHLLNEMDYIELLEKDRKMENELIDLLNSTLIL